MSFIFVSALSDTLVCKSIARQSENYHSLGSALYPPNSTWHWPRNDWLNERNNSTPSKTASNTHQKNFDTTPDLK